MPPGATIIDLRDARRHDSSGGKARGLARLIAHGVRVPPGFVVLPGALDDGAVRARAATLGDELVVRSSSILEDGVAGAAPGVFETVHASDPDEIAAAIATVRASARSDTARAYALFRDVTLPAELAVIVQRRVRGTAGALYSRSPLDPERMLAIVGGGARSASIHRMTDDGASAGVLTGPLLRELRQIALALEGSLGNASTGLDIEWVSADDGLWIVQARAIVAGPEPLPPAPADVFGFAVAEPDLEWRLDIEHNPEPLSRAHAGLVERVRDELGHSLALAGGYLYEAVPGRVSVEPPAASTLEALFFADIEPALDARLGQLENRPIDLDDAIDAFLDVARRYRELSGPLRAARAQTADEPRLSPSIGAGLWGAIASSSRFASATRARAARHHVAGERAYWEPYATRWDIAAPCYDEQPEELDELVARLRPHRVATGGGSALGVVAAAIAELDDRLFYRAQRLVRRAILGLAGPIPAGARFGLNLHELESWARRGLTPALIAAARDAPMPTRWRMPLTVRGDTRSVAPPAGARHVLRGTGRGGQVGALATRSMNGEGILVAFELTPGDVLAAARADGIILEGSSLLGHAAAMASELGIPIITRVAGAVAIAEGERLWMDGDAGVVVRASPGRT